MSPSSSTEVEITVHSDKERLFLDTVTGATRREPFNEPLEQLYGTAVLHHVDPAMLHRRRWLLEHPEEARRLARPQSWRVFWDNLWASIKESW